MYLRKPTMSHRMRFYYTLSVTFYDIYVLLFLQIIYAKNSHKKTSYSPLCYIYLRFSLNM